MASSSKPVLSDEVKKMLEGLTFDEQRVAMGIFIKTDRGQHLWDLITGLRGPDSPSERPDRSSKENKEAYALRRKRKYNSTEIIRSHAFFGVVGGSARYHGGEEIILPPSSEWDHFDKHMARAAQAIGLRIMDKKMEDVGGF